MNKLREKRNALYSEASKLVKAASDEGRPFTEEEKTAYQSKVTEIRSLDEQIGTDEELRALALAGKADKKPDSKEQEEIRAFEAFLTGKETRDAVKATPHISKNQRIQKKTPDQTVRCV